MIGSGREAANDKVAKLVRMTTEAKYHTFAISDTDVRVRPDYLRSVVAPLSNPKVGAVTCMYTSLCDTSFAQRLQSIGMISDFYPGILVARLLDGVKFALGQTIVTTRRHMEGFGGYQAIEKSPGDDLLVGRMIEEQDFEVVLFPRPVETVADFQSMGELLTKRLRWMTVMRHMRPWGHLGLIFTQGLLWSICGRRNPPYDGHRSSLLRTLCRAEGCHNNDRGGVGPGSNTSLEEVADHPDLGRDRIRHLVVELHSQDHHLAQSPILDS